VRALALLPLVAASCNSILGFEDTYPRTVMKNCEAWRASGQTIDGSFLIDPDEAGPNPAFSVWCANMAGPGAAQEYLELTASSTADATAALQAGDLTQTSNYAIQKGGGDCACAGAEVTTFSKVKLDITTLEIDVFDRTFADVAYTQNNQSCFATTSGCTAGEMAYGSATNCNPALDLPSRSVAGVDLSGTPFFLTETSWVRTGRLSIGAGYLGGAPFGTRATITGGGDCGGMVPQNGRLPISFSAMPPAPAPVLQNGSFDLGNLTGWTSTGGGSVFVLARDTTLGDRETLSSYVGSADAAQGTVEQTFVVPRDVRAIEFAIAGTGGRVVLKDGATELQVATPPVDAWIYQTFWIADQVGKSLTLVIEDATATAHVKVSGFDMVRGSALYPIQNPGFVDIEPLVGWLRTGDLALSAQIVPQDQNRGTWQAASTTSGQGAIAQTFSVPSDAVGLRFAISGSAGQARLYSGMLDTFPGSSPVYTVPAPGDSLLHAVSWDLTPYRGTQMTIAFEDFSTTTAFEVLQLVYVSTTYGP
jgi:hypothetical protein